MIKVIYLNKKSLKKKLYTVVPRFTVFRLSVIPINRAQSSKIIVARNYSSENFN
jgi:hypothetical protein